MMSPHKEAELNHTALLRPSSGPDSFPPAPFPETIRATLREAGAVPASQLMGRSLSPESLSLFPV